MGLKADALAQEVRDGLDDLLRVLVCLTKDVEAAYANLDRYMLDEA